MLCEAGSMRTIYPRPRTGQDLSLSKGDVQFAVDEIVAFDIFPLFLARFSVYCSLFLMLMRKIHTTMYDISFNHRDTLGNYV